MIEHAFGIMKQKYRQLYYCKLRGMEKLCHFIRACCVLHNLCISDEIDNVDFEKTDDYYVYEMDDENDDNRANDTTGGKAIRDMICEILRD